MRAEDSISGAADERTVAPGPSLGAGPVIRHLVAAPGVALGNVLRRFIDRAVTRLLRLPPHLGDYTRQRDLAVPMRDGVTLLADLYRPHGLPKGTLLAYGPYGRRMDQSLPLARAFAVRGYTVLLVSSRGTFGSGGTFEPMRDEVSDGADVVRWMTAQSWFTGTFTTIGVSYLGFTQWALLVDPPPQMEAAVVVAGPHDIAQHSWGSGAFKLDLLRWSKTLAHQEESWARVVARQFTEPRRLRRVLHELPIGEAGHRYLNGRASWYRDRATQPDIDLPVWASMRLGEALARTDIPVFLMGGWHDLFLDQTLEQYVRLRERGVDVALTVGPWTHLQMLASRVSAEILVETLEFLDGKRPDAVRFHVAGDGWRASTTWPPPAREHKWFPGPGGRLGPVGRGRETFTFDPADPTPTVGGPTLDAKGVIDDSALALRDDVLVFTSEPLTEELEVIGSPVAEIAHRSDNPNADLFIRLSEVGADGRSRNVTEGYLRLAGQDVVTLPLRATAHRFAAGKRLRLLIAGGSHPHFARNLGTGENPSTGRAMRPATHEITLGELTCLRLPVTNPSWSGSTSTHD